MTKTFACPYFGLGVEVYDGQVTMRDPHGVIKVVECVRWADQSCDMCRGEPDDGEEPRQRPRELHE